MEKDNKRYSVFASTVSKMDTMKNNKLEAIEELLSHRNSEVVKSCIRSMELDLEANTLLKNAIELEKEASESHDRKLLDKAVRLYIDSEILKKQSNVEFQRAKLQDFSLMWKITVINSDQSYLI